MDAALRRKIYEFIEAKGLRKTAPREAIITAAFSTTSHYTADELLGMAKKIEPSVSRATVYRTLPLLVECGVLREMDFGKEHKFYDPNFVEHPTHNHLICVDCDKIVEFEDRNMETLENCITKRLGFSPASKMIRIEATCDELKSRGACKNRGKCD
ncbi:MAG: Fur family transcriptional regulator, ferric uptake regulator [Chthoniobacter sp.]|jgi:Fur family ferric uptake transcriptional regulator|nr:Fur family transcriptional regulator, ferric uptake regulator [Chthoniobacter sp.]